MSLKGVSFYVRFREGGQGEEIICLHVYEWGKGGIKTLLFIGGGVRGGKSGGKVQGWGLRHLVWFWYLEYAFK